jgi:hypothetical protein
VAVTGAAASWWLCCGGSRERRRRPGWAFRGRAEWIAPTRPGDGGTPSVLTWAPAAYLQAALGRPGRRVAVGTQQRPDLGEPLIENVGGPVPDREHPTAFRWWAILGLAEPDLAATELPALGCVRVDTGVFEERMQLRLRERPLLRIGLVVLDVERSESFRVAGRLVA